MRVIKSELARDRERERWERRKEAGHEHMLPLCAKPHWLRQPTHTLHCCCCCHSSPLQHQHHGTTQSNKAGEMNLERDGVSPVSVLPGQGCLAWITQPDYTHTHSYIYRVVAFSCLASHPLKFVTLLRWATIQHCMMNCDTTEIFIISSWASHFHLKSCNILICSCQALKLSDTFFFSMNLQHSEIILQSFQGQS